MPRRNAQVVVRVSDAELEQIDRLAVELHVASRSDVLRCALDRLGREAREHAIGEAYRRGYSRSFPADPGEQAWDDAADALIAEGGATGAGD
jgi:Ribbon-helix-helix protein, copG family